MRIVAIGLMVSALVCSAAMAQTAAFKCARTGTVVEFADGTRVTAQGQEGNYCKLLLKQPGAEEHLNNWYAPTVFIRASRSQSLADQVKPWTLWPLSVGKKLTGRFDGTGSNASFGAGSWHQTISVDSYEKVSTKAGTFDVFVVTRLEEGLSNKYRSTFRQWYAPELGVAVKFTFSDNQGASRTSEATAVR
jgi:hypothetical protein